MGHTLSSMRRLTAFTISNAASVFHKKYWRALNKTARHVLFLAPPKLSAAQRSNEDVLIIIFSLIDTISLASCAAVCKAWLDPARRHLYATITLHAGKKSAPSLASALRSNLILRGYIRRINLTQCHRDDDIFVFDWLVQLPSWGIQRIDVNQMFDDPQFLTAFSHSPALKGVRHLTLHGVFFRYGAKLEDYLSLPSLESLAISFPVGFEIPDVASAKPIKRLSIVSHFYEPWISELLHVYGPSLVRLDVLCTEWTGWESLPGALIGLRHLQELTIHARFTTPTLIPFLDDVVPQLPELRSLFCTYCTWSAALLRNLPPTLRFLKLHELKDYPFPVAEAASVMRQWGADANDTYNFTLVEHKDPETLRELAEACKLAGVEFKWEAWKHKSKLWMLG